MLKKVLNSILFFVLWVLFSLFWGILAWQLQSLFLYLGLLVIDNPTLRPTGWNTQTIQGIYRCGFFLVGSLWLGLVIFTMNYLRDATDDHTVWPDTLRLFLGGTAVYLLVTGILFVLSAFS